MRSRASRPRWRRLLRRSGLAVVAVWGVVTLAAFGYDVATSGSVPAPPLDGHGHDVRTGALTTHYESWDGRGTPVVLVHGFLESASVWREVAPLLAAAGHRVYAIDVRGYGYTERQGPYTLRSDTTQLLDFIAALRLTRADGGAPLLVGHSSGAAIVGNAARLRPDAVAGVVFLDGDGTPYGVGPGWVHRLFVDPYATALIRLITRHPSLAASVYRQACGPRCPPFDPAQWIGPFRVKGADAALRAILSRQLIGLTYAQERQIRVPAAVVFGSQDREMTAADAEATARRLRTSRVVAIRGAGHLVMLSDPTALVQALTRLAAPAGQPGVSAAVR